jgi:hypothetical protein
MEKGAMNDPKCEGVIRRRRVRENHTSSYGLIRPHILCKLFVIICAAFLEYFKSEFRFQGHIVYDDLLTSFHFFILKLSPR